MLSLAIYFYVCWGIRSSSSQVSNALLTTALIIGLYDYLKERISTLDGFLGITPLCIPLTIEHSTRFLLRTVQGNIAENSLYLKKMNRTSHGVITRRINPKSLTAKLHL